MHYYHFITKPLSNHCYLFIELKQEADKINFQTHYGKHYEKQID